MAKAVDDKWNYEPQPNGWGYCMFFHFDYKNDINSMNRYEPAEDIFQ